MNVFKAGQPVATAIVTVNLTLEIKVDGSWGADCTVKQVQEQAAEGALGHIRNYLQKESVKARTKIVGEPIVSMVIATKEAR